MVHKGYKLVVVELPIKLRETMVMGSVLGGLALGTASAVIYIYIFIAFVWMMGAKWETATALVVIALILMGVFLISARALRHKVA